MTDYGTAKACAYSGGKKDALKRASTGGDEKNRQQAASLQGI
jgi:hypothetical protein